MKSRLINLLKQYGYEDFFHDKPEKMKTEHLLSFKDNIFVYKEDNKEKELYCIHEKKLSSDKDSYKDELKQYKKEIEELVQEIYGFTVLYGNQLLSYNSVLVLICNFNPNLTEENGKFMALFEKNKYYCRKIFLNTSANVKQELPKKDSKRKSKVKIAEIQESSEENNKKEHEELMILPFLDISSKYSYHDSGMSSILDDLKEDLRKDFGESGDEIYSFLKNELSVIKDIKKINDDKKIEIEKNIRKFFLNGGKINE